MAFPAREMTASNPVYIVFGQLDFLVEEFRGDRALGLVFRTFVRSGVRIASQYHFHSFQLIFGKFVFLLRR